MITVFIESHKVFSLSSILVYSEYDSTVFFNRTEVANFLEGRTLREKGRTLYFWNFGGGPMEGGPYDLDIECNPVFKIQLSIRL